MRTLVQHQYYLVANEEVVATQTKHSTFISQYASAEYVLLLIIPTSGTRNGERREVMTTEI